MEDFSHKIIKNLENIINDLNNNKSKNTVISKINNIITDIKGNNSPAPLLNDNNISTISFNYGVYVGETKNGVPDGRGKLTYTGAYNGDIYEGTFKKGEPDGEGTYYHKNGNMYK